MVNSNFSPQDKKPGDLILSADWNAAMTEIKRLDKAKVSREGADALKGPLTIQEALNVTGDVKISGNRLKSADGFGIVETNKKDWLRINPDENYPAIALHKPVAIVSGGLAIGEWGQQPQGVLKVTQSTYLATAGGNVGIGTIDAKAKLHIASGDLRLDTNREIFFADNGQIRSLDNNHRILFRRDENKLELRESGDIIFSPGATAGNETAKVVLQSNGSLGIGINPPAFTLDVNGAVRLGGFTGYDRDEWPQVVWYRDTNAGWDEGLIKNSSTRGVFNRPGFGIHLDQNKQFGLWSSGWTPLFAVKGGTGDAYFRGNIGIGKGSTEKSSQWTLRTGDETNNTQISKLRIRDEQANRDRITIDENGNVMFTGTVTATAFIGIGAFVKGMILMWSGMPREIPQEWQLCDGKNGTPDLRDRFIVGASAGDKSYKVGDTGGSALVTLTIDQMPLHNHNYDNQYKYLMRTTGSSTAKDTDYTQNEPDLISIGEIQPRGGDKPHENRPPYYALCFIMKS